jgi:hypothetical protein
MTSALCGVTLVRDPTGLGSPFNHLPILDSIMPGDIRRRSWPCSTWVMFSLAGMLIALVRRSSGLDPASLWLDDQWVALALRHADLARISALHIPTPLGWSALEKLVISVSPDRDWALQIVPFVMGLVSIPLFCKLASRVVTHPLAIGLACLLVSCHPVAELYATRVKHYTLDLTICIALLALLLDALQAPSTRRFVMLTVCSLIAALVSFASLFVSLCGVHALLLDRGLQAQRDRAYTREARSYLIAALLFDLGVAALYLSYFEDQSSPAMRAFWVKYFLRFDSFHSVFTFFWRSFLAFPMQAVSAWLVILLVWVALGLREAARDPVLRPLVWAFAALVFGLVVAAALQIYPMGVERTALFAYPLFWLFAAIGVQRTLLSDLSPSPFKRKLTWGLAVYVTAISLFRPRVVYSDARDRQVVEAILRASHEGDALLTAPLGLLPLSYYGGKPVQLVHSSVLSHQMEALPTWHDLFVLPNDLGGVSLRDQPAIADAMIADLCKRGFRRILYASTNAIDSVDQHVVSEIERDGYRHVQRIDSSPRARLFLLSR